MSRVRICRCPRCGQDMKTAPNNIKKAIKKCVFCGKNWKIYKNVNDHSIVKF